MDTDPNEHPERDPDFARGEDAPEEHPEDEHLGRFSTGEEELPEGDPRAPATGASARVRRTSPRSDPEKHEERRFSEGQDDIPPEVKP